MIKDTVSGRLKPSATIFCFVMDSKCSGDLPSTWLLCKKSRAISKKITSLNKRIPSYFLVSSIWYLNNSYLESTCYKQSSAFMQCCIKFIKPLKPVAALSGKHFLCSKSTAVHTLMFEISQIQSLLLTKSIRKHKPLYASIHILSCSITS